MLTYVRAEDQDGRIYELVCDGDDPTIPNVRDSVEKNGTTFLVKQRGFDYEQDNEVKILLKVLKQGAIPKG